ncbi:Transposase, Mutator family [Thermoanaerobacter sp. YS13]|nr:Transposase, Mutator family [Thermoanaerobacter sp. YS13]
MYQVYYLGLFYHNIFKSPFCKFPEEVRKIMYTTNIIEGFYRQLRKVTKSKTIFPSDEELEKMLYLVTMNVLKKWTVQILRNL